MKKVGIKQFYNTKYDAKDPEFWKKIEMPSGPDKEYVCIGVKASNYFILMESRQHTHMQHRRRTPQDSVGLRRTWESSF